MKRTNFVCMVILTLFVSMQSLASTVLWYDFEDLAERAGLSSNPGTASAIITADLSGNGYDMWGWASASANNSPLVSAEGATASGEGYCLEFTGSQDGYVPAGGLVWSPTAWTIEASFLVTTLDGWNTFVGNDGSTEGGSESDFYLSENGIDNRMRINIDTLGGERWILDGDYDLVVDTWYHIAIVSDGVTLEMWLDDGSGFQMIGSMDISAQTVAENALPGGSFTWTFGRGWYNGNTDHMDGSLDDIRFSDEALDVAEFLQTTGVIVGSPSPKNRSTLVARDTSLSWSTYEEEGSTIDSFDVYFSTDPNDYAPTATVEDPDPNAFEGMAPAFVTTGTTALLSDVYTAAAKLPFGKVCGWRVDAYVDGATEPVIGSIWTFTTVPQEVTITMQPESAIANPVATLHMESTETTDYQWYKDTGVVGDKTDDTVLADGAVYDGVTTNELTITVVPGDESYIAYEGLYYCAPSNERGVKYTVPVYVVTARMVGHWTFDDQDLTDSIQDTIATAPVHNGELGLHPDVQPSNTGDGAFTYVAGISGMALQLTNDSDYMAIDGDESADDMYITDPLLDEEGAVAEETNMDDFFNFYREAMTVSLWYKYTGTEAGWRLPMNKLDAGVSGWLFGVDPGDIDEVRAIIETGGTIDGDGSGDFNDGQWHMMTITYDLEDQAFILYTDGDYDTTLAIDLMEEGVPTAPVSIGGRDAENSIDAAVDDVRMYSYAMTAEEVAQLYVDMVPDAYICIEQDPALSHDYNNDCRVNLADFEMIIAEWLECQRVPVDSCVWSY